MWLEASFPVPGRNFPKRGERTGREIELLSTDIDQASCKNWEEAFPTYRLQTRLRIAKTFPFEFGNVAKIAWHSSRCSKKRRLRSSTVRKQKRGLLALASNYIFRKRSIARYIVLSRWPHENTSAGQRRNDNRTFNKHVWQYDNARVPVASSSSSRSPLCKQRLDTEWNGGRGGGSLLYVLYSFSSSFFNFLPSFSFRDQHPVQGIIASLSRICIYIYIYTCCSL